MPAFYRNFYFKAPRFHLEHSHDHILHIRLRPNQVSLGIIAASQRLELIAQLDTTAAFAYGPMMQLAKQEEPILSQSFKEVHITMPSVAFTPVPILTATSAGLEEIHEASGGGQTLQPGTRTRTESVVDLGIHFTMDFVQEDLETISQLFPGAHIRCEEMVAALLGKHLAFHHAHLILAGINQRHVTIAVFQQQNLSFLNRFSWDSPQDILYFLQLAHHAAGNAQQPDILLFGEFEATSEPLRTLFKHLPNARILGTEAGSLIDDPEQKVPSYRFADLAM